MAKLQVYNLKGKKAGTVDMPKDLLAKENASLLTQAVHVYEDRSHKGTARVKTRGEITATTAKMYRQKGTGNARHGSRKAPIFKGGGVAHGPKGVKKVLSLSRNLKEAALKVAMNLKVGEGKIVVADKLSSIGKTKDAQTLINEVVKDLGIEKNINLRVVLSADKKDLFRFFRNIKGLDVNYWRNLNAAEVYRSNLIIVDKDSLQEEKTMKNLSKDTKILAVKAETPKKPSKKPVTKKPAKATRSSKKAVKKATKKTKKGTKK